MKAGTREAMTLSSLRARADGTMLVLYCWFLNSLFP